MEARPSAYYIKQHLLIGIPKRKCLVCKKMLTGQMLRFPGQMRCSTCGVTYQIDGCKVSSDMLDKLGLKREDCAKVYCDCFEELPVYRAYWEETKSPVPLGTFHAPILRRKLIADKIVAQFYEWLWKNRETYRKFYPKEFGWEKIGQTFGAEGEPLIVAPW